MKSHVVEFTTCDASIGYQARKITLGPESDLVRAFLDNGLDGRDYSFVSERMAIFIEPKIDSGFPDVVLAEFKPNFFDIWKEARNELSSDELRLLTYLYSVGGADFNAIKGSLRLQSGSVIHSLELLLDADLIDRDRKSRCWIPRSLNETYGISRLIAIEAKVCNSEDVLTQASLNRWFASESYALTPIDPKPDFVKRARSAGVGIVTATKDHAFKMRFGARRFMLPSSYASWQFNEWIGRRLFTEGVSK